MTKRYKVTGYYNTRGPDGQVIGWVKGTEVELDDAVAEWVQRDCAGLLVPLDQPAEEVAPPVEVPNDVPDAAALATADEAAVADDDLEDEVDAPAVEGRESGSPERDRSHRAGRRRH